MKSIKTIALVSLLTLGITTSAFASFSHDLKYGSSGQEVKELQDFLVNQGCLSVTPTGKFYGATLQAVKCFQKKNTIKPTGYFGPASRKVADLLLAKSVTPTPQEDPVDFSLDTASGSAPLTVTFTSAYGFWGVGGEGYEVDFGDGTSPTNMMCDKASTTGKKVLCDSPISIKHTYTNEGAYTVAIRTTPPSTPMNHYEPHVVAASKMVAVRKAN